MASRFKGATYEDAIALKKGCRNLGARKSTIINIMNDGFLSKNSEKLYTTANLNLQNPDACLSVSHKPRKVAEIKSKV